MFKNNLNIYLFKIISILSLTLIMSLLTISITSFAITTGTSSEPKPITTINYDVPGEGALAGNKVVLTFDSGEEFQSTVKTDLTYSIPVTYPHIRGRMEIVEFEGSTTTVADTKEFPYDITVFNTDKNGKVLGPVIFSGTGQVPGSQVNILFPSGENVVATVDSNGNYNAQPKYPSPAGDIATSVGGVPTSVPYDGGITTLSASQVSSSSSTVSSSTTTSTSTSTSSTTTGSTATSTATKATATKATVRSGGFLQIASVIALFTVILAILVFNKKFKSK